MRIFIKITVSVINAVGQIAFVKEKVGAIKITFFGLCLAEMCHIFLRFKLLLHQTQPSVHLHI